MARRTTADIVLINPRFEVSYWGLERALPLLGKRTAMPVAALPLLAALTPSGHHVRILDENVEPLDFDHIARADIVGVTGMSVQRTRMREILAELRRREVFTVVGGPWISVDECYFGDLPQAIFVGEAEETWPRFLEDWQQRTVQRRYEQAARTDMTTVPVPRLRAAVDAALSFRQPPAVAGLSVPVRVLRHHRHLRPPSQAEDGGPGRRRARCAPRAADGNRLHRGRQPHRQQEGRGAAARDHPGVAGGARVSVHLRDRSVARPGGGPRADAADARRQHPERLHRHRESERSLSGRDQEIPERAKPAAPSWTGSAPCRPRAWRCGRA